MLQLAASAYSKIRTAGFNSFFAWTINADNLCNRISGFFFGYIAAENISRSRKRDKNDQIIFAQNAVSAKS